MKRKGGNRFITAFTGYREGPSPSVREFLKKYGDLKIRLIQVNRLPINSAISRLLNVLSLGQVNRRLKSLNYDKLFHLFTVIQLSDGQVIRIDKDEVVKIVPWKWSIRMNKKEEIMPVSLRGQSLSLNQLFERAENEIGKKALWVYHPVTANCQFFTLYLLSPFLTPPIVKFVSQSVGSILNPVLQSISTGVTNVAHKADILLNGEGLLMRTLGTT